MTNFEKLLEAGSFINFISDLRAVHTIYEIPLYFEKYRKYGFNYEEFISDLDFKKFFIKCSKWLMFENIPKKNQQKCHYPDGISIKPDGVHELDPCLYEEVETIYNVNVRVLKCKKCGHVELEWFRN